MKDKIKIGTHEGIEASFMPGDNINGHVGIYGISGVGKSHLLQVIAMRLAEAGETAVLLDSNGSHTLDQMNDQMRKAVYQANEVDAEKGIPIPKEYITDEGKALARNLAFSVEQAGVAQQDSAITALKYCVEEGTLVNQGIIAVDEALELDGTEPAKRIRAKLDDVTSANAFRIGDGLLKEGVLNVIHVSGLSMNAQRISKGVILGYFWDVAQRGRFKEHPIYIFLDEIHSCRKGVSKVLGELLSEGRKFGVNIIFATQTIGDFRGGVLSHRISQVGLRFIFCPAADEVDAFAKSMVGGNRGELTRRLKTLKVGECIVDGGIYLGNELKRKPIKIKVDSCKKDIAVHNEATRKELMLNGNNRGIVRAPKVQQSYEGEIVDVVEEFIVEGGENDGTCSN